LWALFVCAFSLQAQTSAFRDHWDRAGFIRRQWCLRAGNRDNDATGVSYKQTTTQSGLYAFAALPVGTYSITVESQGFKKTRKTGNILVVNTPLPGLGLEVGGTTEVVEIKMKRRLSRPKMRGRQRRLAEAIAICR